jgi:hypothetical protein
MKKSSSRSERTAALRAPASWEAIAAVGDQLRHLRALAGRHFGVRGRCGQLAGIALFLRRRISLPWHGFLLILLNPGGGIVTGSL